MFKSIGSNWILNVVNLVVSLILTRTVVGTVGEDLNGGWQNIVNATGYLTLLLLGVPMASVRFFSQAIAAKDVPRLNRCVAACLAAYLVLGLLAALVGAALYAGFDAEIVPKIVDVAARAGDDPAAAARAARTGYWIMTLYIAAGFASQTPYGVLAAYREFEVRNYVMIASLLVRLGATLVLLEPGPVAYVRLGLVQLLCLAVEFVAATWVVKRRRPEVRFGLRGFDRALLREVFGFGVWVLLLNLGNKLMFQTDALVIGWRRPLADVTTFEVAKSFVLPITEFVVSIAAVVMPTVVRLKAEGRLGELDAVFLKWSKIALGVSLLPGLYLCAFGGEFLREYMPPHRRATFDWSTAGRMQAIFLVAQFAYLPVRGVAMPILTGLGKPARATLAFLASGVLNLALSVWWIGPYGLDGVAWGTLVPTLLFSAYLLVVAARETGVSPAAWLRYVIPRAAVGSAVVLAGLFALKRWWGPSTMTELIVAGVLSTAAFGVVWAAFVHRGDRHVDLLALIAARRARRSPA